MMMASRASLNGEGREVLVLIFSFLFFFRLLYTGSKGALPKSMNLRGLHYLQPPPPQDNICFPLKTVPITLLP